MYAKFALACLATMAQSLKIEAEAEVAAHSCHSTADRNKQIPPSFADNLKSNYRMRDLEFPADESSLYWRDMGEKALDLDDPVEWKRAYTTFAGKGKSLFGDGISPDDVNQGSLGNCWFLSAASSIAEFPGRMEKVFLNKDKALNPQGVYGVNFWTLGVPHTVIVDDYLPLKKSGDTYKSFFSKVSEDGSLWAVLLEKAFAKYHGNYAHIEGGAAQKAVSTMTGAPAVVYHHNAISADDLWAKLLKHDENKDIMTCGSPAGSDKTTDSSGLVQGHAFTLMSVKQMSNGVKMLKIRNPWGSEKYHGTWSDKDSRWTAALKAEAGMSADMDDGIFHMDIDTFKWKFSESTANYNTENMKYDYFLMLNDNTPASGANNLTKHDLTIVSTADQDVYVTAHTWDRRGLSKQCKSKVKNSLWYTPAQNTWFSGANTQTWKMTKDGKSQVSVNHDFSDGDLASDWSVVAWGSKAPVYVYHNKGYQTQALPVQGGPTPPTRPALPKYDYSAFKNWASAKGKESAYTAKFYTEVHDDHEWIMVHNLCPASYAFKYTVDFDTAEIEGSKYNVSNTGKSFEDSVVCTKNGGRSKCVIDLLPGQFVGFVAEPGFKSNNIGYSSAHRSV